MPPRMHMVWSVLERAKDAGDDVVIAACRRLIVAHRLGWKRHADPRDYAMVAAFDDLAETGTDRTQTMKSPFDTLPAGLADKARALVAKRENAGLNVRFVNARGEQDQFSFATIERADAFRAAVTARGLTLIA